LGLLVATARQASSLPSNAKSKPAIQDEQPSEELSREARGLPRKATKRKRRSREGGTRDKERLSWLKKLSEEPRKKRRVRATNNDGNFQIMAE